MIPSLPKFALKPTIAAIITLSILSVADTASAHHPFGGETPDNAITGFLSGLGHPVIGFDHLAFVVAAGCIAVLYASRGIVIPIAFTAATVMGTVLHLGSIELPLLEVVITASVLCLGALLAMPKQLPLVAIAAIASFAGIFHGFAYGEAIFGAEMTPLLAYLAGFALIQLGIAVGIYLLVSRLVSLQDEAQSPLSLRFAGFAIAGIGAAFLSGALLG